MFPAKEVQPPVEHLVFIVVRGESKEKLEAMKPFHPAFNAFPEEPFEFYWRNVVKPDVYDD